MIITIELQADEELTAHFPQWILGSASAYERRHKQPVPQMTLRLIRAGKTYHLEGGFWIDAAAVKL
jgi:hypothetical protein